jgi:hypothetical protein
MSTEEENLEWNEIYKLMQCTDLSCHTIFTIACSICSRVSSLSAAPALLTPAFEN